MDRVSSIVRRGVRVIVAVTCLTATGITASSLAAPLPTLGKQPAHLPRSVPTYTVTPITSGWTSDAGFAINDNGAVVGQNRLRTFAWIPSSPNATTGTLHALPSLAPDATAAGYGIDGNNRVVGFSRDASSRPNPVTWTGDYSAQSTLTLRSGVVGGQARGINSSGVVTGTTGWTSTDSHLARWNADGTLDDLGKPARRTVRDRPRDQQLGCDRGFCIHQW